MLDPFMKDHGARHVGEIRLRNGRIVKTITSSDTAESRNKFDALNVHKTRGVARSLKSLKAAKKSEGGADADIVDQPVSGGPTHEVVSDGGGRRLGGAMLYVIFWGSQWSDDPGPNPSLSDIVDDMQGIMSGAYLDATVQYGVGSQPGIPLAQIAAVYIENRALPLHHFSIVDINYEAWLSMTDGPVPTDTETVVCVIMPPGATPIENYDGEHDHSLQPDLYWVPTMWVKYNDRGTMSALFSHELVETLTDPDGDGIQLKPTSSTDWHEIADVCQGLDYQSLNGVMVASYWSAADSACIVPQPEVVQAWIIQCFHKKWGDDNPNEQITVVGGVRIPSGDKFWMEQIEVITRIENGDRFVVIGADGVETNVVVAKHFPAWAPQGTKYITTEPDQSKLDNLLSLPDCGSLTDWN